MPASDERPSNSGGILRTVLLALFLLPWSFWWGLAAMIMGALKCRRICTRIIRLWAGGILFVAGIKTAVRYAAPLDPHRRHLFLSNHQSALDIPILMQACPATQDLRFMAKESLFKIPFFGWGMSRSGFVPIRRQSPRHSAELFQNLAAKDQLYSFVNFPEGTRSPGGRLQPFKKGALGLALRLNLPAVPVSIIDGCRANPNGSLRVRPGLVRVVFHEPLDLASGGGRDEWLERIHATIAAALPEDQKP